MRHVRTAKGQSQSEQRGDKLGGQSRQVCVCVGILARKAKTPSRRRRQMRFKPSTITCTSQVPRHPKYSRL